MFYIFAVFTAFFSCFFGDETFASAVEQVCGICFHASFLQNGAITCKGAAISKNIGHSSIAQITVDSFALGNLFLSKRYRRVDESRSKTYDPANVLSVLSIYAEYNFPNDPPKAGEMRKNIFCSIVITATIMHKGVSPTSIS